MAVDNVFDAGARSECCSFRLHVGYLHQPVLSTAVLHSDTCLRRQQCKHQSFRKRVGSYDFDFAV